MHLLLKLSHEGVEPRSTVCSVSERDLDLAKKQVAVQSIIGAYRFLGSRWANLDPLHRRERPKIPELEPSFYGLSETDMDSTFSTANTYFGADKMTLRDLIAALKQTYCSDIGIEFMYISDPVIKRWWQQNLNLAAQPRAWMRSQRNAFLKN